MLSTANNSNNAKNHALDTLARLLRNVVGVRSLTSTPYPYIPVPNALVGTHCFPERHIVRVDGGNPYTRFTWSKVRLIGAHLNCERVDKGKVAGAVADPPKTPKDRIYLLNNIRFAFADLYLAALKSAADAEGTYSGSTYYDSDIDVTVNQKLFNEATFKDPCRLLRTMVSVLFKVNDVDPSDALDMNVYLANFEVHTKLQCVHSNIMDASDATDLSPSASSASSSINSDMVSHPSLTHFNSRRMLICRHLDERPYGYYRLKDMFPSSHCFYGQLRAIDKEVNNLKGGYIRAVKNYYKAVCEHVEPSELSKLLFYAMVQAKDQYFCSASYQLVVLPAVSLAKTEEELKKGLSADELKHAAWDNFGLLVHVLESSDCEEPTWLSKVAKYMGRIQKWTVGTAANGISENGIADLRAAATLDRFNQVFDAYLPTAVVGGVAAPHDYALEQLMKKLGRNVPTDSPKRIVLAACFKFMITHFDVFATDGGGSRKRGRVPVRVRKAFDIPMRLTGHAAATHVMKHFTKQQIIDRWVVCGKSMSMSMSMSMRKSDLVSLMMTTAKSKTLNN